MKNRACRGNLRQELELKLARPYWANAGGQSVEDVVWRQAVKAEAAVGRGEEAAASLQYLSAHFERFRLPLLAERAHKHGADPVVGRRCINTYQNQRHLSSEASWKGSCRQAASQRAAIEPLPGSKST